MDVPEDLAKQLLILLTFVIGGTPDSKDETGRSEETKLAGCRCLLELSEALTRSRADVVGKDENLPAVGHTVEVLLGVLRGAEMVELQMVALKAVRVLLLQTVRDKDVVVSFYPGVVSTMVKVVGTGKTTKRSYLVLGEVVKLVDALVSEVLLDREVDELSEEATTGDELKVRRSKPWARLTAKNTKVALEQILKLRTHPKVEVRRVVFEMCRNLLEKCAKVLEATVSSLVESMIVLAGDPDEGLASLADSTIRVTASINEDIKDAVRNCLDRWITGLPRVMTGNDEEAKQRVISRLSLTFGICVELGLEVDLFRDMLAGSIKESIFSTTSLAKPATAMISTNPTQHPLQLLGPGETSMTEQKELMQYPDIIMDQRSQFDTMSSMKSLLGRLGNSSDNALSLAQRYIRDVSVPTASPQERVTSLWISINLLHGSLDVSNEMDMYIDFGLSAPNQLQRRVTDELFSLSLSTLEFTPDTPNPQFQCLALESFSLIAQTQKRQFRSHLVEALYPVVHHLGDPSPQVQSHAIITLNNITTACEYSSAKELLLDNVDYMINAISLKLNIFDLSPQAPVVLNMMLKLVGPRLVPFLDDLVESIFDMLDGYHENQQLCEDLFSVLSTVVDEASKDPSAFLAVEGPKDTLTAAAHVKRTVLSDDDLLKLVRTTYHPPDPPEDDISGFPRAPWGPEKPPPEKSFEEQLAEINNPTAEDEDDPPPPEPESDAVVLPKTYTLITRIVELGQHFAMHESMQLRYLVLELITTSATPLSKHYDTYLPLIAKIWPAVVDRVNDPESAVVCGALHCLRALVVTAGDFVGKRLEQAWPLLRRVYEKAVRGDKGLYSAGGKVRKAFAEFVEDALAGCRVNDEVLGEFVEVAVKERCAQSVLEEVAGDEAWLERMLADTEAPEWRLPKMEGVVFVVPVF